jgi:hypothetical protein
MSIMRYRRLSLGLAAPSLMLVALCGWSSNAAAQPIGYDPGSSSSLTVTALPLEAQVSLDGVPLGSAHDLVARAVVMVPGDHVVEVWAPGYLPTAVNVFGEPDFASHINLVLAPDRRP